MLIPPPPPTPKCVLDPAVVNEDTMSQLSDIGLSFFADLCGRNRGVMVVQSGTATSASGSIIPGTFGCTKFPSDFALAAGLSKNVSIVDANAIPMSYHSGMTTAAETTQLLDYFVQNVYTSSPKVQEDPYACNVNGLARLDCPGRKEEEDFAAAAKDIVPIRAVTLAGLFTYVPWATHGIRLTLEQAQDFYRKEDFDQMKQMGLNAVQIPVPIHFFHNHHNRRETSTTFGRSTHPWLDRLTDILAMATEQELQTILVLEEEKETNDTTDDVDTDDDDDSIIAAAAQYAVDHQVLALTLPRASNLSAARTVSPTLNLLIPILQDDLKHLQTITTSVNGNTDPHVFAALDLGHTGTVADVASSSSLDDRMKLFYHESLACVLRAPLEYSACYQNTQVFVSKGFDLSIDDCVNQKYHKEAFVDYGQCGRLEETIDSPWWKAHRTSFLERQQFSYEKGLGWSFAAWKLYNNNTTTHTMGVLDHPERLLSLRDVTAAGLVPNGWLLLKNDDTTNLACLNPPANDFVMGDATLAPVPAPPPDCGNGWWNETIHGCSYWIPPITSSPTPCPMLCPDVATLTPTAVSIMEVATAVGCPAAPHVILVGTIAAILGLMIGAVIGTKVNFLNRRQGYQEIAVSV